MLTLDASASTLLIIDFQLKLMPAIHDAPASIANARRLVETAKIVGVPRLYTEQNAKGLGPTVQDLAAEPSLIVNKMSFGACLEPEFLPRLPQGHAIVATGWETHICVLQTVLGLIEAGRQVFAVRDAVGSRRTESKEAALRRMERHGADIVTAEMVVFEWLKTAKHPKFREVAALIK